MTIEVNTTPVVLFVQQSVIFRWFIFSANLGAIHITLVRKPQSHTCGFAPDLYVTITQPSFPLLFLAPCSLPVLPCSLASLAPFPCFFTLLCAPFPCPFPLLLATCPCFLLLFLAECSFSSFLAPFPCSWLLIYTSTPLNHLFLSFSFERLQAAYYVFYNSNTINFTFYPSFFKEAFIYFQTALGRLVIIGHVANVSNPTLKTNIFLMLKCAPP